MKVKSLTEKLLLEKSGDEIKGTGFGEIKLSSEVSDLIDDGNWQAAYDKASTDTTGQILYAIYVYFQPDKEDADGSSEEMKSLSGYMKPVSGYLKETGSTVKVGEFNSLKNLFTKKGTKLFDVYKLNDGVVTDEVVREGIFQCVANEKDATLYDEKNSDALISELQGFDSGLKTITKKRVYAKDVGAEENEKDVVVNMFLKSVLGTNYDKINGYEDLVAKAVREVGLSLEQNPLIKFLAGYLKDHELNRNGFIVMNNLYANGVVDGDDFEKLPLLSNSDIYTKRYNEAEEIVGIYQNCANGYSWNANGVKNLYVERTGNPTPLGTYTNGDIANLICYEKVDGECQPLTNRLLPLDSIKTNYKMATGPDNALNREAIGGEDEEEIIDKEKSEIKVTGVPPTISGYDEGRWRGTLGDIGADDIPSLMAYLRKIGLI